MNTKKYLLINISQFLTLLLVMYMFFFKGFENESVLTFLKEEILAISIISVLLLISCLINIGFITRQVLKKKNCFRIALLFQIGIIIYFIYEIFRSQTSISVIITIISLITLGLQTKIIKELYQITRKIFLKNLE